MDCELALDFHIFLLADRMVPIYTKPSVIAEMPLSWQNNNQPIFLISIEYYKYNNY